MARHTKKHRRNPTASASSPAALETSLRTMKSGQRVVLGGLGVERKGPKFNIAHIDRKKGSVVEKKGVSLHTAARDLSAWEKEARKGGKHGGSHVRSNPTSTLERHRQLMGRAEHALVKTDASTREYEALQRELRGGGKARRFASGAARVTRAGVTTFPITAVLVAAAVAGVIGYNLASPSTPTTA